MTPLRHRPTSAAKSSPSLAASLLLAALACGCAGPAPHGAAFDPDSVPEAHARATGALMWPGATRAFLVTPEGALTNGAWTLRLEAASGAAIAPGPRAIAAEEGWRPVLHWRRRAGPVRFEFEAAALPGPAPGDADLVVSLEVRAVNAGDAPAAARVRAALAPRAAGDPFVAPDAAELPGPAPRWAAAGESEAHAWCGLAPAGQAVDAQWTLAPGESRVVRFALPAHPARAADLARWARTPHAARMAEARRWWRAALDRGFRVTLGDAEVERALSAARVVLLGCTEDRGGTWAPVGNPFQYRDVWLRDGARAIRALSVSGHTREARALAEGFLAFQWPGGAFLSQRGQLDGTGQALWALEQALLRPPPREAPAARVTDAALAAWRWCEVQRSIGRRSDWEFGAMLPFAEPRDAELTRAQLVGNDAWAIAGYRAVARLLDAAGRGAEAESVRASRERYLADVEAALERCGDPDVPASWQRVGRDWGNLSVAFPCGALPAAHPRAAALARRVWAEAGGAGLGRYGSPDSLHTYLAADLATWALFTGRRAQADSVLDAMLAWRTASGGAGEIVSRSTRDFGSNLPPHATAAAALVSLVRDMLVADEGDTLCLTLGARAAWWGGSRVRGAPTRFGTIDLAFRRDRDAAEWSWSPVRAWTALGLPPGSRLAAPPPAPLVAGPSSDVVLAPPGTRRARVALAAAGSP
jgi:hypothetical protein